MPVVFISKKLMHNDAYLSLHLNFYTPKGCIIALVHTDQRKDEIENLRQADCTTKMETLNKPHKSSLSLLAKTTTPTFFEIANSLRVFSGHNLRSGSPVCKEKS